MQIYLAWSLRCGGTIGRCPQHSRHIQAGVAGGGGGVVALLKGGGNGRLPEVEDGDVNPLRGGEHHKQRQEVNTHPEIGI